MQMRKVVNLGGKFDVEFLDKKKVKVKPAIANAFIKKYQSMRKPADKEKFQNQAMKSYKDLLQVLKSQYMAAAWFKYDVGPITVQLSEYRDPLSHFVVSLCAIVGGVFTVLGLVDAVVHQTYINVLRKVQMGKAN